MINTGDFIMWFHNIYIVKGIRDDRWVDCCIIKWSATENNLLISNKPLLVSIYEKVVKYAEDYEGSKRNVLYNNVIQHMIKNIFEYTRS